MLPPKHSLHTLLMQLCSHICDSLHSLHLLFSRLCWRCLTPGTPCTGSYGGHARISAISPTCKKHTGSTKDAPMNDGRSWRLCKRVALQPGRPPALAAAWRRAGGDGSNMVVCWTASLRPGACVLRTGDESAHGPNRARRKSRSPRSPDAYAARYGGFRPVRLRLRHRWETSRTSARSSYTRHRGPAVSCRRHPTTPPSGGDCWLWQ
jgi:hypothetical protein